MDNGAFRLLESAIHRTLHAHGFSRSSSQASLVLTDLLSRYLSLLAATCAAHAQHAGRRGISPWDAVCALRELGVELEELSDYCGSEGFEWRRAAAYTNRRAEDLQEFRAHLSYGLRQDRDDAVALHYAPLLELPDSDGSEAESQVEGNADEMTDADFMMEDNDDSRSYDPNFASPERKRRAAPRRPASPLSPTLGPTLYEKQRARANGWQPPPHIPDFLPPFPSHNMEPAASTLEIPLLQPTQTSSPVKPEKQPAALLAGPLTASSASDYLSRVPYSQSSLSTLTEWHLPAPAPTPPIHTQHGRRLPTPQTQPALIAAYHHILTHPPAAHAGSGGSSSANPARHRVAMALLALTQSASRWEPADTLYAAVAPCAPRVAAIGPTFPLLIVNGRPADGKTAKEEDSQRRLPPAFPRPVATTERLTPLVSQQGSRVPDLARMVLPSAVYSRTTNLHHPPVLTRGDKKLVYGPGVNAPWNTNSPVTPGTSGGKDAMSTVLPNGKAPETSGGGGSSGTKGLSLQDARLYATWDYEPKTFRDPLSVVARRARTGSRLGV